MQRFRLVISAPSNAVSAAKTWEFSDGNGVEMIECDLKKEHHRISVLTVRIYDAKGALFNSLPDPSFQDVPVTLYLGKPGNAQDVSYTVFQGIITELVYGFPGPTTLQIVAHDKSIDARRVKKYRNYKNKTSTQIAQAIMADYGIPVDVDLGALTVQASLGDLGGNLSDWDHAGRALAYDGLEMHVDPKTARLTVRQAAKLTYSPIFQAPDPRIERFEVHVSHVHGPGTGGDKSFVPDDGSVGKTQAATGSQAATLNKQGSSERTHRLPPGKLFGSDGQSHSESIGNPWSNMVPKMERRKDTATVTCSPLPDISLAHRIQFAGYGAKIDGIWYVVSIAHHPVGEGDAKTILALQRAPNSGAVKQAALAPDGS